MSVPEHEVERAADGGLTVRVRGSIAGRLSEDPESLGLWVVHDPDGQFMGRHIDPREAAAFLAAWFVAREDGEE